MNKETDLFRNYKNILDKIEALTVHAKRTLPVILIAVSKRQSVDAVEELYRLGHRDFGENYVQELIAKAEELKKRGCLEIRWHFIGHLQTNKVKSLIPWVSSVHTVDSNKVAQELSKRWATSGRPGRLPVFVEVNLDGEETKSGVNPEQATILVEKIAQYPELDLLGLMCIPSPGEDPGIGFQGLADLGRGLRAYTQGMLSMGMSGDYPIAINHGATHIRVGTVLFGDRKGVQNGSESGSLK